MTRSSSGPRSRQLLNVSSLRGSIVSSCSQSATYGLLARATPMFIGRAGPPLLEGSTRTDAGTGLCWMSVRARSTVVSVETSSTIRISLAGKVWAKIASRVRARNAAPLYVGTTTEMAIGTLGFRRDEGSRIGSSTPVGGDIPDSSPRSGAGQVANEVGLDSSFIISPPSSTKNLPGQVPPLGATGWV